MHKQCFHRLNSTMLLIFLTFSSIFFQNVLGDAVLCQKEILDDECAPVAHGTSSYKEFIAKSNYFIDTTTLILDIFTKNYGLVQIITTPRQFTKTKNLQMIKEFLQPEVDENGTVIKNTIYKPNYRLFHYGEVYSNSKKCYVRLKKPLQISSQKLLMEIQGKIPVIHLDFNIRFADKSSTCGHVIHRILRHRIADCMRQHNYLLKVLETNRNLTMTTDQDIEKMTKYKNSQIPLNEYEYAASIIWLSSVLKKFYDHKVFIVIDDYDSIFNQILLGKVDMPEYEINSLIKFFTEFYDVAIKNNQAKNLTMITGIRCYPLGTATYRNHHVINSKLMKYYGFSSHHAVQILNATDLIVINNKVMSKYYAYNMGPRGEYKMLNSYSFRTMLSLREVNNYWNGSSMVDDVITILIKSSSFRDVFLRLINRNSVMMHDLDLWGTYHFDLDMKLLTTLREITAKGDNEDTVIDEKLIHNTLKILLSFGYLTQQNNHKEDEILGLFEIGTNFSNPDPRFEHTVAVPNGEIESRLIGIFQNYSQRLLQTNFSSSEFLSFAEEYERCIYQTNSSDDSELQIQMENYLRTLNPFTSNTSLANAPSAIPADENYIQNILINAGFHVNCDKRGFQLTKQNSSRWSNQTSSLQYFWAFRLIYVNVTYNAANPSKQIQDISERLLNEMLEISVQPFIKRIRRYKIVVIHVDSDKKVNISSQIYSKDMVS